MSARQSWLIFMSLVPLVTITVAAAAAMPHPAVVVAALIFLALALSTLWRGAEPSSVTRSLYFLGVLFVAFGGYLGWLMVKSLWLEPEAKDALAAGLPVLFGIIGGVVLLLGLGLLAWGFFLRPPRSS